MAVADLDPELISTLAERSKLPHDEEWTACFFAALGEGVDWKRAVEIADEVAPTIVGACEAMEKTPEPVAESLLEGYDPNATINPEDFTLKTDNKIVAEKKIGTHAFKFRAEKAGDSRWLLQFDRVDNPRIPSQELHNDMGAQASPVFSQAGKLAAHVMRSHDPDEFVFSGYGDDRARLYRRFAKQIADAHDREVSEVRHVGPAGRPLYQFTLKRQPPPS